MKKVLTLFGLLFVLLGSAHAQKGKQAIGFGLSYGTEIESGWVSSISTILPILSV